MPSDCSPVKPNDDQKAPPRLRRRNALAVRDDAAARRA
jgi:hypothetical protein